VADPPLKLVLIEGVGEPGSLNHLGVEVATTYDVAAAATSLAGQGLETDLEAKTTCCYALQDEVWVGAPDGERWEVYTVLADAPDSGDLGGDQRCCSAVSTDAPAAAACC